MIIPQVMCPVVKGGAARPFRRRHQVEQGIGSNDVMRSRILLLSATLVLAVQATAAPEPVQPKFDKRPWTVAYTKEAGGQRITEWLLPGQTVEEWKEMVTELFLPSSKPKEEFGPYIQNLRAGGNVAKVINQKDDDIIYEFKSTNGQVTEFGVHRAFAGKVGIHSVQYAAHDEATYHANKEKWAKLLQAFTYTDL